MVVNVYAEYVDQRRTARTAYVTDEAKFNEIMGRASWSKASETQPLVPEKLNSDPVFKRFLAELGYCIVEEGSKSFQRQ